MAYLENISITITDLQEIRPDISRYIAEDYNIDNLINLVKRNIVRKIRNEQQYAANLSIDELNTELENITDNNDKNIKDKIILLTIAEILRSSSDIEISNLATSYINSSNAIQLEYNFEDDDIVHKTYFGR